MGIDTAVKLLLELKAKYKECTGKDWKLGEHVSKTSEASKPQVADKKKGDKKKTPSPQKEASPVAGGEPLSELGAQLNDDIIAQGNKVRQLKTEKADEVAIKTAVDTLLGLKAKFKKVVGSDWKPAGSGGNKGKEKPAQDKKGGGGQKDKGKNKKQGNEKNEGGDGGAPGGGPQKKNKKGMKTTKRKRNPEIKQR